MGSSPIKVAPFLLTFLLYLFLLRLNIAGKYIFRPITGNGRVPKFNTCNFLSLTSLDHY